MFRDDITMKRLLNEQMYICYQEVYSTIAKDVQTNILKNRNKGTDEEFITT
jgi:hypothetical protein